MTTGEQVIVGMVVLVVGGLLLAGLKPLFAYTIDAIAAAIVKSINGQLGLTELKHDVSDLRTQVENLEGQLEVILTDL